MGQICLNVSKSTNKENEPSTSQPDRFYFTLSSQNALKYCEIAPPGGLSRYPAFSVCLFTLIIPLTFHIFPQSINQYICSRQYILYLCSVTDFFHVPCPLSKVCTSAGLQGNFNHYQSEPQTTQISVLFFLGSLNEHLLTHHIVPYNEKLQVPVKKCKIIYLYLGHDQ